MVLQSFAKNVIKLIMMINVLNVKIQLLYVQNVNQAMMSI